MKKILVGLDGSPRQREVVIVAAALARKLQAKLVLFRAVGVPTELPPEAYLMPANEITRILERRANAGIDEAAKDIAEDLVDSRRVAIGTPWQAICQGARDLDVDLVVIGSHGYDPLDRLLGTTAAKVVNHADRSVLIVRSGERIAD